MAKLLVPWMLALVAQLQLAAKGGYLQWSVSGSDGDRLHYPFDSPASLMLAGPPGGGSQSPGDRVVVFTDTTALTWTLAAFDATTGQRLWALPVSAKAAGDAPSSVTAAVPTRQPANQLNLAFFQLSSQLHAVDTNGILVWVHQLQAGGLPAQVSGWANSSSAASGVSAGGSGVVYASVVQPPSPTAPSLSRNTTVTALAATSGEVLWSTNITAVGTPAFGATPIPGVTASPSLAFYATGARVVALDGNTGAPAWSYTWALAGTGLAPNISDVQYVELPGPPPQRLLLLTSISWQQQRYAVLRLLDGTPSGSSSVSSGASGAAAVSSLQQAAPVALLWQSVQPEPAMDTWPLLAAPAVSTNLGAFLSWTNASIYFPQPSWRFELVARSLLTGKDLWRAPLPERSEVLPAAAPVPLGDRLFSLTTAGLAALRGDSGALEWGVTGTPYNARLQGPAGASYTSVPLPTFSDAAGYIVALRCLDSTDPGTVCVYGGYERTPPRSHATRTWEATGAVGLLAAAGVAILALGAL